MQSAVIEGIVLQKINYSETSIIVKLLTEHEGVKSFIFPGAKNKKKKGNLIAPLAILSLTYFQRNNNALATIQEIEPSVVFRDLPFNPYKPSLPFPKSNPCKELRWIRSAENAGTAPPNWLSSMYNANSGL